MKRVLVKVEVGKTGLLKKTMEAEKALTTLKDFVRELDFFNSGSSTEIKATQQEETEDEKAQMYFFVKIDDEAIKEQVEAVKKTMTPLKEAIRALDKAIAKEITQETPQT